MAAAQRVVCQAERFRYSLYGEADTLKRPNVSCNAGIVVFHKRTVAWLNM